MFSLHYKTDIWVPEVESMMPMKKAEVIWGVYSKLENFCENFIIVRILCILVLKDIFAMLKIYDKSMI